MKYLLAWMAILSVNLWAVEKREVTFGGFIDSYYGFDFNEPTGDRGFTTHAARQNEFSINLAYVDVKVDRERVRGRLALQAGTSVYANYAGERTANAALGNVVQHIQEAYAGYRVTDHLWIDAGIFLSHVGAETFISKDNWNYTRSLGADFSPYYQSGVRLSYQWDARWFTSLHILNGWQNIIENNSDKALGLQVAYTPTETFSITYNTLFSREQAFRLYYNLMFKASVSPKLSVSFSTDLGLQGGSQWYVETLLAQYKLTATKGSDFGCLCPSRSRTLPRTQIPSGLSPRWPP